MYARPIDRTVPVQIIFLDYRPPVAILVPDIKKILCARSRKGIPWADITRQQTGDLHFNATDHVLFLRAQNKPRYMPQSHDLRYGNGGDSGTYFCKAEM
jgi:hypothetical protein